MAGIWHKIIQISMTQQRSQSFLISSLNVGNGRLGVSRLPGCYGNLAGDVRAIRDWGAAIVVSMTTERELADANAGHLGQLLSVEGIQWHHLPIRDFGGPKGDSADIWSDISQKLHACLEAGGAILVHCRGGQGRSGMIALRLMVESGEDPDAALTRLRAVRPGAVETSEQLEWARAVQS